MDLPYWLPPLLFAATLGRKYAALSLGVDFFLLAGIMPVIAALSGHPLRASWWGIRFVADGTLVSLIIVTAFFASAKLERDSRMIEGLRGRLRDRGSELHILRRATAALTSVNRNLEERLVRNDEILTSLWQYSRSLYRLDTRQHFEEMADAIVRLVRVNKLTVLRLDDEKRQLVPVTVRGGATVTPQAASKGTP
ncbi:MAG: hypothetical protein ACOYM2_22225, partial [Rectinemataceae bacterium]